MRIQELVVRRTQSYEKPPSQLCAKVKVDDDNGNSMELILSPGATGRIFDQIAVEIGNTAKNIAGNVSAAARNAADELLLIERHGVNTISHSDDGDPF